MSGMGQPINNEGHGWLADPWINHWFEGPTYGLLKLYE